ncbi:MAG TPA: tetratricopeptide repeat protein [Kofleriaceae bacterium]
MALLVVSASASAAPNIKSVLSSYELELKTLTANMPQPNQMSTQTGQRRLVDAQVAFTIGDYDTASLVLFDLVTKTQGQDKEIATYYLAEALFHKGDRGAARGYFTEVTNNTGGKYYQQSLVRLVEISIVDNDKQTAEDALAKLNNAAQTPAVPYVRGKWAFANAKFDEAIGFFNAVPKGSEYELQATYYLGTVYIAQKDLAKATDVFTDLVTRKPKTNVDRRVIELAQLALGRVYYEREQPSKSIESYLLVDRGSDLFPTALYEVSWVYVKSKQYDKALTALELLTRLDPESTTSPTVRILEGNLRIRKAQLIRKAQITGTLSGEEKSDPMVEYTKAEKIFNETHDRYYPAFVALDGMVKGQLDPASFIDQISGRNTRVFASSAPIPEAAAQWLREEPAVQRVVSVESDLADIQSNLNEAEATIVRLEGVLATGDRLTLYPALSSRRMRIAAIQHDLIGIRSQLHDQAGSNDANRKSLVAQYQALGDPERAHGQRTAEAQGGFDKIDDNAQEVEKAVMSMQAMAVALRTFAPQLPDADRGKLQGELDDVTKEARAIEDELADIRKEVVLGKDLAPVGDSAWLQARELRQRVKAALDNEHRNLGGRAGALADQAARISNDLEQADQQIDALVGKGLEDVKRMLTEERKNLVECRQLLSEYEQEARTLGSEVLGYSFKTVKDKLDDIVVRSDVGNVDVAWSQREDTDDDLKRLNLARARDLKQLRDEFRFVLDETSTTPAQPKLKEPMPGAGPEGSSPDKGGPIDTRIKPAGDQKKDTTSPTVKPDANQPKTAPKTAPKAAPKGGTK